MGGGGNIGGPGGISIGPIPRKGPGGRIPRGSSERKPLPRKPVGLSKNREEDD